MTVIPTGIYNTFYQMADLFITEINAGSLTLYYPTQTLTTPTTAFGEPPRGVSLYGAREPVHSMPGRFMEAAPSGASVVQASTGEAIACRLYWNDRDQHPTMRDLNIQQSENRLRVVCYNSDAYKMVNAAYAEADCAGRIVKLQLIRKPVSYGLGPTKRYAESIWKEMV